MLRTRNMSTVLSAPRFRIARRACFVAQRARATAPVAGCSQGRSTIDHGQRPLSRAVMAEVMRPAGAVEEAEGRSQLQFGCNYFAQTCL